MVGLILGAEYDLLIPEPDTGTLWAILAGVACGLLILGYFLIWSRRNRPPS